MKRRPRATLPRPGSPDYRPSAASNFADQGDALAATSALAARDEFGSRSSADFGFLATSLDSPMDELSLSDELAGLTPRPHGQIRQLELQPPAEVVGAATTFVSSTDESGALPLTLPSPPAAGGEGWASESRRAGGEGAGTNESTPHERTLTAWYLTDQVGSVRDIANITGSVLDHIAYRAYGGAASESSPANGDRFKFNEREVDVTTGLYYERTRWYDPTSGRFLSQDPLQQAGGDSNLYRSVHNAPTTGVSPLGTKDGSPAAGPGDYTDAHRLPAILGTSDKYYDRSSIPAEIPGPPLLDRILNNTDALFAG
jgi:RHS repeat-associated protein